MYRRYPDFDEGKLTDLRKIVVNSTALSRVAIDLGVGEFVLLGRGEEAGGGRTKTSILANALEAVFGAVYLDSDSQHAYEVAARLLNDSIDEALAALKKLDAKSQLQELAARLERPMPEYRVTNEGPDHAKNLFCRCVFGRRDVWQRFWAVKKGSRRASGTTGLRNFADIVNFWSVLLTLPKNLTK